jgi:serine/threonine protein kinase
VDDYAGRVLADRYRLPRPPADEYELVETRAFDTYSGQEVLVRQVLLPEVVGAEPTGLAAGPDDPGSDSARRALDAARAAAAITDHPRLVQVFDIFIDGGSLWVVSELVSARPLAALLADKRLSPYRAAEVASDVLYALRAVHAHGWTHRNVTAATVLVCDDGRAMLTGLAVGAAQEALCGYDSVPEPAHAMVSGGSGGSWSGPDSVLELERARQARITVIGPVTERWAPEQAAEIQDAWQLAPPVGPEADLWALGALLFRSVQGHPAFPEESTAELVQLVCAEPPAFAEECGPLRPIVESLLRQDASERPDFEELGGWLRSLVRSAPEPELGAHTIQVPADPQKLPIVRRRGELVRRRKAAAAAAAAESAARHRHARSKQRKPAGAPRSLGKLLVAAVFILLAAVVLYALVFMPRNGASNTSGSADTARTIPAQVPGSGNDKPTATSAPTTKAPSTTAAATPSSAPSSAPSTDVGSDFQLRTDPAGFSLAVPTGWQRSGKNSSGQIRYTGGDYQIIVVPGRDSVADFGSDPLAYQSTSENELAAFHSSDWSSVFGTRRLDMGGVAAAEGEYTWREASGRDVYANNLAMIRGDKYHVILVVGPSDQTAAVKRYFDKAAATYRTTA